MLINPGKTDQDLVRVTARQAPGYIFKTGHLTALVPHFHLLLITRRSRTKKPGKCLVLEFGGTCRDRTYDHRIKSPVLYQLS